jgi:hypothetical protein
MADETRSVDVALRVTKEGDTGAFKEVAEDLAGLESPAQDAAGFIARLFEEIRKGAGSTAELEQIHAAMDAIAQADAEFANAEGLKQQREAISDLQGAWSSLGDAIQGQLESNKPRQDEFLQWMERLRSEAAQLDDPITAALANVEQSLDRLNGSVEKNFRNFGNVAGTAGLRLKELRDEIERAEAEGRDIGEAPRASLERLQKTLEETNRKYADFKNAQQDAKDAQKAFRSESDLGRGSINDLGDVLERTSPRMADMVGKGFAIAGAFTAGWAAGGKIRDVLNDLTQGGFDKGIQAIATSAINLFSSLDNTGDQSERLRNLTNILVKNGIDPAGLSIDEMAEKVANLGREKHETASAAEALAKSVGLSKKELDEQSKTLVKGIESFAAANKQLTQEDLGKQFGKQVQELLDHYASLKQEAPPAIQQIAAAWKVTTSDVEAASKKQESSVKGLVESITGAVSKLGATLPEQLEVMQKAFEQIDFSKLDFGSKGYQEAERFLKQYVSTLLSAGKQVPESVAAQAASFGILVPAMNVVADGSKKLGLSIDEATTAASKNKLAFDPLTGTWTNVAAASKAAGDTTGVAADKIKTAADGVGEKKTKLQEFNEEIARIKSGQEAAGKAADDGAKKVVDGAQKIGDAKTGLKDAGTAADEAAGGLKKIGDEAASLDGEKAAAAKSGADKIKTEIGSIAPAVDPVVTALSAIKTVLEELNSMKLDGLKGELSSVLSKINEVKQAFDSIDGAGGGEGAPA